MRMSCNGCRILRKGCNEDCILRPCLEWIKSPESQANATIFLAKFYGRAGLLNLINAAPLLHRPAIFRSLLYEACGRIINPIYGSVGLMSSGSWEQCQSAVDSVLNGSAIMQLPSDDCGDDNAAVAHTIMSLKSNCDIRHLSRGTGNVNHDRLPIRKGSKRSPGGARGKAIEDPATGSRNEAPAAKFNISDWEGQGQGADHHELNRMLNDHDSFSVGTVEATILVNSAQRDQVLETRTDENCEVLLELTLGWNQVPSRIYGK